MLNPASLRCAVAPSAMWRPNSGVESRRYAWVGVNSVGCMSSVGPKLLSACHWSCTGAGLTLVLLLLLPGLISCLCLGSLLLLVLPQHLRILVRARSGWHAIHHALLLLLLGAPSRSVHRILSDIVSCYLILHQALLHDVERLPVGLLLAHVWILGPDLVLNFHDLRLNLRR